MWADGVHHKFRGGQAHSCVLDLLGVRLDGTEELIALGERLRASTVSWGALLRDCPDAAYTAPSWWSAPAMGLWRAQAEVLPAARHQHCWPTRPGTSRTACRSPHNRARSRPCKRSATGRTEPTPGGPSRRSPAPTQQVAEGRREDPGDRESRALCGRGPVPPFRRKAHTSLPVAGWALSESARRLRRGRSRLR
ncbi:hypothetical protein [Streptacidiphilus fuscans]|uniref:hypothetical protein n=1 Tax=Streptacidiphilus fuscans TaxID=2789292 RepID=UPI002E2E7496|nr:hypothetical protein [Streptacidiphilus fuscans]